MFGRAALSLVGRQLCRVRSLSSRLTVKEATAVDTAKENVAVMVGLLELQVPDCGLVQGGLT